LWESVEAVQYVKAFGDLLPDNLVFVVIPGAARGIRFVRSCILLLQAIMRRHILHQVPFDVFHTLDDDWSSVRVFDHINVSEEPMHPCSLYMALTTNEAVIVHHLYVF
jgi:hypothetical protein